MFIQAIQEATASEPLTLEEEYENQVSWRESHDKLTFILCQPIPRDGEPVISVGAGEIDVPEKMIGDINFFLYPFDNDADDEPASANSVQESSCVGEIDIMIAGHGDRGKGLGKAAVSTFLHYIWSNRDVILREYQSGETALSKGDGSLKLELLMVKIKATNVHSIALFKGLGFEQEGDVNYFGEVKLVLKDFNRVVTPPEAYAVVEFSRHAN